MAAGLFFRTLPYVFLRFGVHLLFGLVLALFLTLMGGVGWLAARMFGGAALPVAVVALVALGGVWGLSAFTHRYVLYLVRAGHVAVLAEMIAKGGLPAGVGQVAYGNQKVLRHFSSASALFAVDQVVAGSVRQALRWLTRSRPVRVTPGAGLAAGLAGRVLGLAANYVDEAVMSHIGLAAAAVAATAAKWALADPAATVAMVAGFQVASRGRAPSPDVRMALLSVSGRFRRLAQGAAARADPRKEPDGGPGGGGDGRAQA